jgi:hypothetical protein
MARRSREAEVLCAARQCPVAPREDHNTEGTTMSETVSSNEQAADAATEEARLDGIKLAIDQKPHPRDFGGKLVEMQSGWRWIIEGPHNREQYYRWLYHWSERQRVVHETTSTPENAPSHRQIIFNWAMGEPDFATQKNGYWGDYDEVERVDALIEALGLPKPTPIVRPEKETVVPPDTLVRWIDAGHWRCRCKSPGDININLCTYCGGCGTHRPEQNAGCSP